MILGGRVNVFGNREKTCAEKTIKLTRLDLAYRLTRCPHYRQDKTKRDTTPSETGTDQRDTTGGDRSRQSEARQERLTRVLEEIQTPHASRRP